MTWGTTCVAPHHLHHRITRLAAQDTSAAMAKTYDVEVWLPSVGSYVEVSSAPNARDCRARRGNIRHRPRQGRSAHLQTLNASGLATSRLVPALLEQHQRADGTVAVPEALRRWIPCGVLTAPLTQARRVQRDLASSRTGLAPRASATCSRLILLGVNGLEVLPVGGQEFSPLAAMWASPTAASCLPAVGGVVVS
ncbi:hypothetical protein [Streptomyces sp. TRM68367]|uniref:hypothetical protein n=1 Tax=Streptomyces sp. TRM68367 TaxID=2758415 RepID=UPI0021D12C26|nr:hypothetical protein [Streptomyces sp. TRM68367]